MYSHAVSGANFYGQWFTHENIIEGYKPIDKISDDGNFDLNKAKIVQLNWSYNLYEVDGKFYVSGYWGRLEHQLTVVPLPIDFPKDCKTMIIVGSDYYVHMIDAEKQHVFVLDLKFDKRITKVILPQQCARESESVSNQTKYNRVLKAMMTSKASILMRQLNREVQIFAGMYPRHVRTDHVTGRIIDVQCGYEHYMCFTDMGKVYTWGDGKLHQLGHGRMEDESIPVEVAAVAGFNIKKIVAGGWHSAVLTASGDLYTWGRNEQGQCGIKSLETRKKEVQEGTIDKGIQAYPVATVVNIYDEELNPVTSKVIDVCCGSTHTAVLLSDYSIWVAGSNDYGQLGLNIQECFQKEHFVKVHQGTMDTALLCGPWTTVIVN